MLVWLEWSNGRVECEWPFQSFNLQHNLTCVLRTLLAALLKIRTEKCEDREESKISQEATAMQVRDDSDSGQNSRNGGSNTWSDSGYIFKTEPTDYLMNWVQGMREREESRMISRFLA